MDQSTYSGLVKAMKLMFINLYVFLQRAKRYILLMQPNLFLDRQEKTKEQPLCNTYPLTTLSSRIHQKSVKRHYLIPSYYLQEAPRSVSISLSFHHQ